MRLRLLDPLRGLAALWVFTYHWKFSDSFQEHFSLLHRSFREGYLGVAMFFVISGFCITASARGISAKQKGVKEFMRRRLRRIYPTYWCSILVLLALPYLIESLSFLKSGKMLWPQPEQYGFLTFSFFDWFKFATLTQAFTPAPEALYLQDKFSALNAVYWTLAIEVQFYIIVGLFLFIPKYFYHGLSLLTVISIPFAVGLSYYTLGVFLPYWPMFAYGVGLYWLLERGVTPALIFNKRAKVVAAGVMVSGACSYFYQIHLGHSIGSHLFAPFFALTLWFAQEFDQTFTDALARASGVRAYYLKLFLTLGAMSYSLYLIHGKVVNLSAQILRQVVSTNTILFDALVIVLTCLFIFVFYWLCERPFVGYRKSR